jgi:hypothetical protein
MVEITRARWWTAAIGLSLACTVLLAIPAAAQSVSATGDTTITPTDKTYQLAAGVLVFFFLVIVAVLWFLRSQDADFNKSLLATNPKNMITGTSEPFVEAQAVTADDHKFEIKGPTEVTIDGPATFTAHGDWAADVTWSVNPASNAALSSAQGAEVEITAKIAGDFTLVATLPPDGAKGRTAALEQRIRVTATEPKDESSTGAGATFFFSGRGYGTVVIALVVAAVTTVLATLGVLTGQAVAGLLGALLGYVFTGRIGSRDRENDRAERNVDTRGGNGGNGKGGRDGSRRR